MHTQNCQFNKNYLGKFFMLSTCLNRESSFAPPPKRKSFKNKKALRFNKSKGKSEFEFCIEF